MFEEWTNDELMLTAMRLGTQIRINESFIRVAEKRLKEIKSEIRTRDCLKSKIKECFNVTNKE